MITQQDADRLTTEFGYTIVVNDCLDDENIIKFIDRLADSDIEDFDIVINKAKSPEFREIGRKRKELFVRKIDRLKKTLIKEYHEKIKELISFGFRPFNKCTVAASRYYIVGTPILNNDCEWIIRVNISQWEETAGVCVKLNEVILDSQETAIITGSGKIPEYALGVEQCDVIQDDNPSGFRNVVLRKKPGADKKWHPFRWHKEGWSFTRML